MTDKKEEYTVVLSKRKVNGKKQEYWFTGPEKTVLWEARMKLTEWERSLNGKGII